MCINGYVMLACLESLKNGLKHDMVGGPVGSRPVLDSTRPGVCPLAAMPSDRGAR